MIPIIVQIPSDQKRLQLTGAAKCEGEGGLRGRGEIVADSSVSSDPRCGGGTGTELPRRHVLTVKRRRLEVNQGWGGSSFSVRT